MLTAKNYRQKFLEEIGFPLIRANAERFVSGVGDLRKTENLKLVYERALLWKEEQSVQMCRHQDERIAQLEAELEQLRSAPELEVLTPEEHLVTYTASIPEESAETVLSTVLSLDDLAAKDTYRKLAKALHPDTSRLPKNKAEALIKIANRLYQTHSSNSTIVPSYGLRKSKVTVGTTSWVVNDDIDF
jgi:hypothetical protein